MNERSKIVSAAIEVELLRQRVAARSWGNSFEGLNPSIDWDAVGRAAIEAMREPTPQMIEAGSRTESVIGMLPIGGFDIVKRGPVPSPRIVWKLMIDAALRD